MDRDQANQQAGKLTDALGSVTKDTILLYFDQEIGHLNLSHLNLSQLPDLCELFS